MLVSECIFYGWNGGISLESFLDSVLVEVLIFVSRFEKRLMESVRLANTPFTLFKMDLAKSIIFFQKYKKRRNFGYKILQSLNLIFMNNISSKNRIYSLILLFISEYTLLWRKKSGHPKYNNIYITCWESHCVFCERRPYPF